MYSSVSISSPFAWPLAFLLRDYPPLIRSFVISGLIVLTAVLSYVLLDLEVGHTYSSHTAVTLEGLWNKVVFPICVLHFNFFVYYNFELLDPETRVGRMWKKSASLLDGCWPSRALQTSACSYRRLSNLHIVLLLHLQLGSWGRYPYSQQASVCLPCLAPLRPVSRVLSSSLGALRLCVLYCGICYFELFSWWGQDWWHEWHVVVSALLLSRLFIVFLSCHLGYFYGFMWTFSLSLLYFKVKCSYRVLIAFWVSCLSCVFLLFFLVLYYRALF